MDFSNSVYFLRDPRDMTPRYIGISKHPRKRFLEHWTSRKVDYMHKGRTAWFRDVDSIGKRPILDVVFSGLPRIHAIRCESVLIANHHRSNPGQLLQDVDNAIVYVDHDFVMNKIADILSQCSPSCKRAVVNRILQSQ